MSILAFFVRILFFVGALASCTKLDQDQIKKDVDVMEKIIQDVREIESFPCTDHTVMV